MGKGQHGICIMCSLGAKWEAQLETLAPLPSHLQSLSKGSLEGQTVVGVHVGSTGLACASQTPATILLFGLYPAQ